ncbi:MAG: ABC-2 type transport system ATP-binding protein, partial [Natronomonas sp.]
TWLARRDEVLTDSEDNPRIGMDGLSYAGGIQLNTAAVDDRLDAIIPRWAWHDLSHSLGPDDVIKRGWTSLLYAVGTTGSLGLTSGQERPQLNDTTGMTPRLTEIYAESTARNELADRHEAYFKTRSAVSKLDELGKNSPPALFISGLNDVLFTPDEAIWNYDGLRERGVESRLVLFEGAHTLFGATPDADTQAIIDGFALDWMDDHVKRKGNADLPPVTYYDIQSEVFKTTDSIPEPSRDLDLAGTGGQRAGTGEQTVVLNSGEATSSSQVAPRNDDAAPGATAAEFAFDITEDVELLGSPELTLPIQPIGTETKLFAKLYHVEDGEETLIHDQVTPFRLEGTQTREVTQEMVALQRQLAAGDQLKLVIATTDAGFYASRESAGARLLHGEGTLSLPVAGEKSPGKSGQTSAKNKPRADD